MPLINREFLSDFVEGNCDKNYLVSCLPSDLKWEDFVDAIGFILEEDFWEWIDSSLDMFLKEFYDKGEYRNGNFDHDWGRVREMLKLYREDSNNL